MLYVSKNNTCTAYAMISQQLTPDSSLPMTLFPIPPHYIETRVGELLMSRITPAPNPLFWEFPSDLVYTYYKPRY